MTMVLLGCSQRRGSQPWSESGKYNTLQKPTVTTKIRTLIKVSYKVFNSNIEIK